MTDKPKIKLDERKFAAVTRRWTHGATTGNGRREDCDTFVPGSIIGGAYLVEQLVGKGGMGAVYRARHRSVGRTCAVKVLYRHLIDQENWKRFQIEAKTISNLNHQCFVQIYDLALHEKEQPYYVMDFLTGTTLEDIVKGWPIGPADAMKLFLELADGLSFAHSQGVIHRDLKPSNIFVVKLASGSAGIKILDFGIAKLIGMDRSEQSLTALGDVFGTPYYMSPDQCLGESVDLRSDIYSFGCTLFEAISGHPPYCQENPVEVVQSHISDEVPRLSEVCDFTLPAGLSALVEKCMAKYAEDRYQTMLQVVAHLRLIAKGEGNSIAANPAVAINEVNRCDSGKSGTHDLAALAAIAAVGLALGAVATFPFWVKLFPSEKPKYVEKPVEVYEPPKAIGGFEQDKPIWENKHRFRLAKPDGSKPSKAVPIYKEGQLTAYRLNFGAPLYGHLLISRPPVEETKSKRTYHGQKLYKVPTTGSVTIPADQEIAEYEVSSEQVDTPSAFNAFPDNFLTAVLVKSHLAEKILKECQNQARIKSLTISFSNLTASGLKEIERFSSLTNLTLRATQVDQAALTDLVAALPELEKFILEDELKSDCKIFSAFKNPEKLKSILLCKQSFSEEDIDELSHFSNLEELELVAREPFLTDKDLKTLSKLSHLKSIVASPVALSPASTQTLSSMQNLENLDLQTVSSDWKTHDILIVQQKLHLYGNHCQIRTHSRPLR